MTRHRWLTPVLMFLLPLVGAAQPNNPPSKPQEDKIAANAVHKSPSKNSDPCRKDSSDPTITRVLVGSGRNSARVAWDCSHRGKVNSVYLGQWLTVEGFNLKTLVDQATETKPLELYLHGMPLSGVKPYFIYESNGKLSGVRFELHRTEESKDTWAALLGRPKTREADVNVSLGLADCGANCTNITNSAPIHLVSLRTGWLWGFIFVLVGLLILILWLAKTRGLLRDRGIGSSWSLARTQMAWWTFFVVGSFLFIWMVTGNYSSLSGSVLALIGISSGTALLGAVIDDTKENQQKTREALEKENKDLRNRPGALSAEEQARLQEIDRQLKELPPIEKQTTKNNILFDILSDEYGVSFHRLQIVIWTVVLTAIFVVRVYATLSMPDFDAQLLGLTGISAGTYLGFKFPEKKV